MSYPRLWNSETSLVDEDDYNAIVKYFPVKGASYIIRINGSYYEAINGSTGKLSYGGENDAGGASGTVEASVIKTAIDALPNGRGLIIDKTTGEPCFLFFGEERVSWTGSFEQLSLYHHNPAFSYLSRLDDLTGWSTNGTSAVDTETKVEGEASIKLTATNLDISSISRDVTLDLTGKHLRIWIKADDYSAVRAIYVQLRTSVDWTDYFTYTPVWPPGGKLKPLLNEGLVLNLPKLAFGEVGSPDWADIKGVQLQVLAEADVTCNVWFDDWRIVQNEYQALLTFRFDDSYVDVYTWAKPKLDKYGYKGVICNIAENIGSSGNYLSLSQLANLYDGGWDIVGHGETHFDTLTQAEIQRELINTLRWHVTHGFTRGIRFFVPPGHDVPDGDTFALIQKYFLCCQWITSLYASTLPPNSHTLTCIFIPGKSLAELQTYIDNAISTNSWITFYCHGAEADWGTDLEDILDYIQGKNIKVVTFSDVFDKVDLPSALEDNGSATIANGTATVKVTHGLAGDPTSVRLTGTHAEVKNCIVTNVDPDGDHLKFEITTPDGNTSDDRTVYWKAEYKP